MQLGILRRVPMAHEGGGPEGRIILSSKEAVEAKGAQHTHGPIPAE
jgi:hypothetical protein